MKTPLYQKTKELLSETKIAKSVICRDLEISERWIYRAFPGKEEKEPIRHPSVHTIQRLHDYLSQMARKR